MVDIATVNRVRSINVSAVTILRNGKRLEGDKFGKEKKKES